MSLEGAIAANRFGLGARPGEIEAAAGDPRGWLKRQLEGPAEQPRPLDGAGPFEPGGALVAEYVGNLRERRAEKRQVRGASGAGRIDPSVRMEHKELAALYLREMAARFALGFATQRPFAERLVWFWSNHFTVSSTDRKAMPFIGAFEREAIRPHITGKFEDMLLASTRHPAMQTYLNNEKSVGPNSVEGKESGKGLNENLGRELMELHTLGVDGGYTQADVIALAKILTGWTVDRREDGGTGFRFNARRHEPGDIVLRGKTYSGGEEAGIAALRDLAHDPATARHMARKFAAYFIADDPPAGSVARLETVFLNSGGDLKALAKAVVDDPEAWKPTTAKMRSPVEYTTAAMRLVAQPRDGYSDERVRAVMASTRMMGEFPLSAPSPKGWPDKADAWSGPDALLDRIEWAKEFGGRLPQTIDAVSVAEMGLGPLLTHATRAAIKACPTPGEAVALLVSSPEFQRR